MSLVKAFFGLIACVWIAGIVAYAVSGPTIVEGSEIVAEEITEKSGIKEQIENVKEERCRLHQENYDRLWERSIENGNPASMEEALARAEISVDTHC